MQGSYLNLVSSKLPLNKTISKGQMYFEGNIMLDDMYFPGCFKSDAFVSFMLSFVFSRLGQDLFL